MQTLAAGPADAAARVAPAPGLGGLKSEDFFRILVSELKQQDPFEPAKTADMISQVSRIRTIELSGELTRALERLTRQQRMSGPSALIGKYVRANVAGPDGGQTAVEGVVTGVRFDATGEAILELDTGQSVRAADVVWVTTLEALASAGPPNQPEQAQRPTDQAGKAPAKARAGAARPGSSRLALDAALRL